MSKKTLPQSERDRLLAAAHAAAPKLVAAAYRQSFAAVAPRDDSIAPGLVEKLADMIIREAARRGLSPTDAMTFCAAVALELVFDFNAIRSAIDSMEDCA